MPRMFLWGAALMLVGIVGLAVLGTIAWRVRAASPFSYPDGYGPRGRLGFDEPRFGGRGRGGRGWAGAFGARAPIDGARVVDIEASDGACGPAEITIKPGEAVTLRFKNQAATPQALIIPRQRIGVVAEAGQAVLTGVRTDRIGEYGFVCRTAFARRGAPEARSSAGRIVVAP